MEYTKCLVELDEVLKYLNTEELEKIPYEIRNAIKEKKDKNYVWNYDESKDLSDQNLNRKTIAMLSYLNMEYLLNDEQRMLMEKLHRLNEEKLEREKSKKYNPNNIFKNNVNEKTERIGTVDDSLEIEKNEKVKMVVKEEKWYEKIFKTIANIFSRNN